MVNGPILGIRSIKSGSNYTAIAQCNCHSSVGKCDKNHFKQTFNQINDITTEHRLYTAALLLLLLLLLLLSLLLSIYLK